LITIFGFNIFLFPFKSDGVRLPNWGMPLMDAAEYTYPYDNAMQDLSTKKVNTLLLVGQYSTYWAARFYFEKYNFHPKIIEYPFGSTRFDKKTEQKKFDSFFKMIEQQKVDKSILSADTILYHTVNNIDLNMNILYGGKYKIDKRVRNSLHSLYVLSAF
jgi:hypothetical protein